MIRRAVLIIAALSASVVVAAPLAGIPDEDQPTTLAAKAALARLDQMRGKARQDFEKALKNASDEALWELERTKAEVMKSEKPNALDEANRIALAMEIVKADTSTSGARPTGDWRISLGTTSRDYRFLPSGTVKRLEGDKAVDAGKLKRDGDWWTFTDVSLKRNRKIFQIDDQVMVVGSSERDNGPIGYSAATRIR